MGFLMFILPVLLVHFHCYHAEVASIETESCITDCSSYHNFNPYCGTDGVTYPNICLMYNAICRSRGTLTVKERGACGQKKIVIKETCNSDCSRYVTDPYCANNDVTYPNRCELYNDICRSGGELKLKYRGKCGEKPNKRIKKIIPIPKESCMSDCSPYLQVQDPFCGNDGTTYPNRCELHNAICQSKGSLKMVHQGKCVVQRHEWQGTQSQQAVSVEISSNSSPLLEFDSTGSNQVNDEPVGLTRDGRSEDIILGSNEIISEWNRVNTEYPDRRNERTSNLVQGLVESSNAQSSEVVLQYPSQKKLPLNEVNALLEGWELLQDDCADTGSPFVGRRFNFKNDNTFIAIYDVKGVLSGVQFSYKFKGHHENVGVDKPRLPYRGRVYVTTYFTEIDAICREDVPSRSKVVEKIILLTGMGRHVVVPWLRTLMRFEDAQQWSRGKCFSGLGQHYWYDLDTDSRCRQLFPISLLYTKEGLLNGFGFNTLRKVKSEFVQHTRRSDLGLFMENVPKCLLRHPDKAFTNMFVLLDSRTENTMCEW